MVSFHPAQQPNETPMPIHRQAVRKRVVLTVAAEQQPCGVQVVDGVGLKRENPHSN